MSGVILNIKELISTSMGTPKPDENISESESESSVESKCETGNGIDVLNRFDCVSTLNNNLKLCGPGLNISNDTKSNIGNVTLQNSSHTTFGNKTIFNAPVTINQFVDDKCATNRLKKMAQKKKIICIASGILICALIVALILILVLNDDKENGAFPPPSDFVLRFFSRDDWNAQPPRNITMLEMPAIRVIIGHTVTPNCLEKSDCASQLRSIQKYQMEEIGCNDIGYNFMIGGDGAVYIGRGWEVRGEHSYGFNARSIGIGFIGKFTTRKPPKSQLYAAQKLMDEGVKLEKLTADYRLYGQRQLLDSESPGEALYEIITKWGHWTDNIETEN